MLNVSRSFFCKFYYKHP